jgi:hypothetical protein
MSGLRDSGGRIHVPFDVRGTVAAPQFEIDLGSILQKTLQRELERQLERRLRRIIPKP